MKVMYVAANPADADSLMTESEISELQGIFSSAAGEPVTFVTFPRLYIEELGIELSRHAPDILHISSHGAERRIMMANENDAKVYLSADHLRSFFDPARPPKLVYVNACESKEIAKALVDPSPQRRGVAVPLAIGTTAPFTNRAARAAARIFYDRILKGCTVAQALEGARAELECLPEAKCTATVAPSLELARATQLYQQPQIVAKFETYPPKMEPTGEYRIEIGVVGCPSSTTQIVLYTDDADLIEEFDEVDEENPESANAWYLCSVVRSKPTRGVIWAEYPWQTYGDMLVAVSGVMAGNRLFSASTTLCEALERFHRAERPGKPLSPAITTAIKSLRFYDGSEAPSAEYVANQKERQQESRRRRGKKR